MDRTTDISVDPPDGGDSRRMSHGHITHLSLNPSEFKAPEVKGDYSFPMLNSSRNSRRKSFRLLCQLPNLLIVITERWEIPDKGVGSVVFKHPKNDRLTKEGRFDVACTAAGHSRAGHEDKGGGRNTGTVRQKVRD